MSITLITESTDGWINWDAAQAIAGFAAAVLSLIPFVLWFVERKDRKRAEAEEKRWRDGFQISHLRFQRDDRPSGISQRWLICNDSSGPLHQVELVGWDSYDADAKLKRRIVGALGPSTSEPVDITLISGGERAAFLLVYDASWRLWKVPYLGRPELVAKASAADAPPRRWWRKRVRETPADQTDPLDASQPEG
jgi:hypothetical protein